MPPGIYAPASTPSSKLKSMKTGARTAAGTAGTAGTTGMRLPTAGMPSSPAFRPPAPASTVPQNPSLMTTYGGGVQQKDHMGRVITTTPGSVDMWGRQTGMGSTIIEDPDQIRRSRDLADEQSRLAMYPPPRSAAPPAGSPNPIDINEIPGLLDKFKPDQVPREPPMTGMPREVGKGPEDRRAAESAAFARAAERIAGIGRGNLQALRSQMTRRGISGSGIEKRLVSENTNNTAGLLGEVVRDQAIEGLRREQDIDDRDLAAGIAQRGQDLGIQSTNYTGGISQRGQDVSQADWKLNALPSILALLRLKSGAA